MTVSRERRRSSLHQARRRSAVTTDDVVNVGCIFRMQKQTREKLIEYIASGLQSSPVDNAAMFSNGGTPCANVDESHVTSSKPIVESEKTKDRESISAWNGDRNSARSMSSSVRRSYSSSSALSLPSSSSVHRQSDRDPPNTQAQAASVVAQPSVSTVSAGIASKDAGKVNSRPVRKNSVVAENTGGLKSNVHEVSRSQSTASIEAYRAKSELNKTVVLEDKQAASGVSSLIVAPSCDQAVGAASNRGSTNVANSKLSQVKKPSSNIPDSKYGALKLRMPRTTDELNRRENRRSTSGIPLTVKSSSSCNVPRPTQLPTSSSLSNISADATKSKTTAAMSDGSRLRIPKLSGKFNSNKQFDTLLFCAAFFMH